MTQPSPPLLLFDGVCNLCNAAVQAVLKRDRKGVVRFASLQSEAAKQALDAAGIATDDLPDSMILIDDRGVHTRSTAAIRLARALGFPHSLASVVWIVPRPVRNWVYDIIARNRYRWFGKRETCMVPNDKWRKRFLDSDP